MGSSRLPGKVLLCYQSETLLDIQIERLNKCSLVGDIIIATSEVELDDPIKIYCDNHKLKCVRGSERNLVDRFSKALMPRSELGFVRFCADRPLFDWRLLEKGIELFLKNSCDIVTNANPATFPKGQTVEIMNREVFLKSVSLIESDYDKEHVMTYFYRNHETFKILIFTSEDSANNQINLCVDSIEDFENFKKVASHLGDNYKDATWEQSVKWYKEVCAE